MHELAVVEVYVSLRMHVTCEAIAYVSGKSCGA